jgi:hypothetical protein
MRYVLLFSDGTITVGDYDAMGPYFVWGKKGWRDAVNQLTAKVRKRREGKIVNLEIQSHGHAGTIVVPGGNITNDNVAQFGGMLRAVMANGGLIEVMACNVASFSHFTFRDGTLSYSPDVQEAYFGGLEKDPVRMVKQDDGSQVVTRLGWKEAPFAAQRISKLRGQLMSYRDNGLEFCLTLARTSGCVVRASSLVQAEEFGDISDGNPLNQSYTTNHFIMRNYDRFGEWDGPTWDFKPNGTVKYLGCSPPRHRLRFPVHKVDTPQQLTYNFREQGGNTTEVGQRPQRMNRNPLPV